MAEPINRIDGAAPDTFRYDEELYQCKSGHRFWVIKDGKVWSAFVFFVKNESGDYERIATGPMCPYCFKEFIQERFSAKVAE